MADRGGALHETQKPPQRLTPPRRSRNSTRDREKAELLALRRLASELEAHLAGLRAPQDATRQQLQSMSSAWKRVAERQRTAKGVAKRKNRDLMAQVQRNADWTQRLWELLRETRAARRQLTDRVPWDVRMRDAAVFRRLKGDAQLAGCQAVEVFAAQGVHIPAHDSREGLPDRWACAVDVGSGSCRLVGVRHVPFDAHTASEAVWAALLRPSSFVSSPGASSIGVDTSDGALTCMSSTLQAAERSQDTCSMKLDIRLPLDDPGKRSCHIDSHIVAKKLLGEERGSRLFVWRMQSSLGGDASTHRIECNDVMWVAVSSCPGSGLASTIAVVAHSQVHSLDTERNEDYIAVRNKFQAAMLGEVEPCVKAILETAENILVDSTIGRRSTADTVTTAFAAV